MKKNLILCLLVLFLPLHRILAQEILVVEPGIGTLNAAIEQYKGDRVYQLQAGMWYQLDATIENVGYHLQIIGEEPANNELPATLQSNSNAEGVVFSNMFTAFGDITIKGIYIMNIDLLGSMGGNLLIQNDSLGCVRIDHCVIDPIGASNGIVNNGAYGKTYFTNNQAFNQGTLLGPNDGFFFVTTSPSGIGLDTLYVENNTFVSTGTGIWASDFNKYTNNYVKFNHNTFVTQKSQFDWSIFENTYIFTNNLMFDAQTQPWAYTWQPMPGGDVSQPMPALIYADTIPGETLPSTRQQFVHYNMLYRNPKFYTQLDELNELADKYSVTRLYYMPLLWPTDSMNAKPSHLPRETFLFANDEAFPKWTFGNYMENIDPQFEDARIYSHSDNFVKWTREASIMHALGQPESEYLPVSEWPSYYWDPDGDYTVNNTWPLFNGVYKNTTLLTASIENLPLGDLNWYPEAMDKWAAHKDEIDAHIQAGNEDKFVLTAIQSIVESNRFKIYPNPAKDFLIIESNDPVDVKISSLDGRTLKASSNVIKIRISDLQKGNYILTVKDGKSVVSQLFVKE